jgi:hypothetical protein
MNAFPSQWKGLSIAILDSGIFPTVEGNVGIWFDINRIRVQLSLNIRLNGELNHDTKTEAILPGIHGRS